MDIITVTKENIEREHICCAISNNNDCQVRAKKAWLLRRFEEGLVFKKCDVRGKCFIEYVPAERAWAPVVADGYLYIDCLWVAGQHQGHGYADLLLNACLEDARAQGKLGLVTLSSPKKKPFLSDPKFLAYKGFQVCDTAAPDYTLMALSLVEGAKPPRFRAQARQSRCELPGLALYYADQCPYTAKYVPLLADIAQNHGVPLRTVHLETTEQAQAAPTPYTTFSLFYEGALVTHEIPSPAKFEKLLAEKGL